MCSPPTAEKGQATNKVAKVPATTTTWPFRQIFPLLLVQFSQAAQVMMLFPMLVFMVRHYGIAGDDHKAVGYYTGVLASMFPLTMCLTCFFWGWLSDRIGRKPVALIGVFSVGTGSILLGFTTNYYMAIAIRITTGLFNNVTPMLKCMIAEMSGGRQAKGMSYFSVAFTSGTLLGPSLAGILAMPCNQYGDDFLSCANEDSILRRYPFLLSFVLFGSFTLFAGVYAALVVPETLPDKHRKPLKLNRMMQRVLTCFTGGSSTQTDEFDKIEYLKLREINEEENENGEGNAVADEENPPQNISPIPLQQIRKRSVELTEINRENYKPNVGDAFSDSDWPSDQEEEMLLQYSAKNSPASTISPAAKAKNGRQWYQIREVHISVFLYALVALFYVAFQELFPLWASARAASGGLSLASKDIGIFMSIGGGFTIPYNLILFPRLVKWKGTMWLLKTGAITCMLLTVMTPFLGLLADRREGPSSYSQRLLQGGDFLKEADQLNGSGLGDLGPVLLMALTLHSIGVYVTGSSCFSSVIMLVNKSSPEEHFGIVNSYGQILASLARVIGPSAVGFLWTLSGRSFARDVMMQVTTPFVFCGLSAFAIFALAKTAPTHLTNFS